MRRFLTSFILFLLPFALFAQRSLSADVEIKNVSGGKVSTTRKHVYCNASGRLVSYYTYPRAYYTIGLTRGDGKAYLPDANEVFTDHDGALSSQDDLMYLFLSRGIYDMGLSRLGYTLKSTENEEGGYVKKTFVTNASDRSPVVEVVTKDYLPVYLAHKNSDGYVRGRHYFSHYVSLGKMSFPTRTTEIMYPSAKDSVVIRAIYSNLKIDAADNLSSFQIPANAKPIINSQVVTPKMR